MKNFKRITLLITLACMLAILMAPMAFAMPGDTANDTELWRVFDPCGYLSADENEILDQTAWDMSCKYGIDVVVWIVDSCEGYSHMAYADDNFDYSGYGFGENYDGVMLLIDMDPSDRGMWISTCGEVEFLYTQYDMDILMGLMIDDLRSGYYFEAIETYLDKTDEFLDGVVNYGEYTWSDSDKTVSSYESSDELSEGTVRAAIVITGLIVGLIVAIIFTAVWSAQMRTGVKAVEARNYLVEDSFNLREQRDRFLYSNVTKTQRQSSSSSGSSHGSHHSSSGRSHGGGGRSF